MEEKRYWAIVCDNFRDECEVYYFNSYEMAKKNYDKIIQENKDKEDFVCNDNECSWFDPYYNEYETNIYITEKTLPVIHNDIIF
jgi:hypothetical protein